MYQALLEIMEPEINKIVESKFQKAILSSIKSFRELGVDDNKIRELLVKNYGLTPKEVIAYL